MGCLSKNWSKSRTCVWRITPPLFYGAIYSQSLHIKKTAFLKKNRNKTELANANWCKYPQYPLWNDVNDKSLSIYTWMWYMLAQTMDAELMCVDRSLPILWKPLHLWGSQSIMHKWSLESSQGPGREQTITDNSAITHSPHSAQSTLNAHCWIQKGWHSLDWLGH